MVEHSVADSCLMDIARLGIRDVEGGISSMDVCSFFKHIVQLKQIVREMRLEFHDIILVSLPAKKALPCRKEIFD